MAWRLYDVLNSQWYDDTLYETQEACTAAARHAMQEAAAVDDVLELIAEPVDPNEPFESVAAEEP